MAPSSSSVFCHIGTDSSATYSEISGTCGTGLKRVLARMKALRSAIMLALCLAKIAGSREERFEYARHQARPRSRRSHQAALVRHLQDRRAPADVLARRHRGAELVRRAMHRRGAGD